MQRVVVVVESRILLFHSFSFSFFLSLSFILSWFYSKVVFFSTMGSITRVTLAAMTIMTLITQQAMGAPAQQQGCQGEFDVRGRGCERDQRVNEWWWWWYIGIDVLYPKDGSSFSRSEQETIYLILGKYHQLNMYNSAKSNMDGCEKETS